MNNYFYIRPAIYDPTEDGACPDCGGSGMTWDVACTHGIGTPCACYDACPVCNGRGIPAVPTTEV